MCVGLCSEDVEAWLTNLAGEMHDTLAKLLVECVKSGESDVRKYPSQVGLPPARACVGGCGEGTVPLVTGALTPSTPRCLARGCRRCCVWRSKCTSRARRRRY